VNCPVSRRRVFFLTASAAAVNFVLANLIFGPEGTFGDVVFNLLRCVIAFAGGWFLVAAAGAPLRVAALAGVLVLAVDHVLLKGSWSIGSELWSHSSDGYSAFGGVLISFVMFAPVAALCSWAGGFTARRAG
jgi:hypothetical protein